MRHWWRHGLLFIVVICYPILDSDFTSIIWKYMGASAWWYNEKVWVCNVNGIAQRRRLVDGNIFMSPEGEWLCVHRPIPKLCHYTDVIMTTIASQITSLTVVYSTVYSDADQRKHQSSPHKGPVTRKMFPFDDVFMVMPFRPRCGCNAKTYAKRPRCHTP